MAITSSRITTKHPNLSRFQIKWERCRTAIAGQDEIKDGGFKYLPPVNPTDLEDGEDYAIYLENAEWYNAVGLTYDAFVGMIFRKDPQIGDFTSDEIESNPLLNNVNLEGDDIMTFIRDAVNEELVVGRIGFLNDYPTVGELGELTINEAAEQNIRPFVKQYIAESIINWKYRTIRGVRKTISVVLTEQVERPQLDEASDLFDHDTVTQYRALVIINGIYSQIVFDENLSEVSRIPIVVKGDSLTEIPFTVVNPNSIGLELEKPPLYDMVHTNIKHYQASGALGASLHLFARSTPFFKVPIEAYDRFIAQDMEFGSTRSIVIPTSGDSGEADAKFMEPGGSIQPIVDQQLRLEERMAAQGARMLSTPKAGVESTDTVRLDMMGELSILSAMAKNMSEGLSQVLTRLLGTDIKVVLNSDFLTMPIDAGLISSLLMSVQAGRISEAQFTDALIRGEAIKEEKKIISDVNFTASPDAEAMGVPAANGELSGREENTRNAEPLSAPNGEENR
ncbi:MAG TPA: DUF4055 domain-containing protein [Flavobacteriales bacterium]|nr:DUF4055 domain-containing protein [Flavobacteriales bacterium]